VTTGGDSTTHTTSDRLFLNTLFYIDEAARVIVGQYPAVPRGFMPSHRYVDILIAPAKPIC